MFSILNLTGGTIHMPKLKVYSSRKVTLSDDEKKELDRKIEEQVKKHERDRKCGGMFGEQFIRLHDRYTESK